MTGHTSLSREITMNVLVLGASGRTGRLLLDLLAAAGYLPVAYGRHAPAGWTGAVQLGAIDDRAALGAQAARVDAAISCLATTGAPQVCLTATETVIACAPPGFRYLVVGGAAVDVPGDSKGLMDKVAGGLMRLTAGRMLAERQAEYHRLASSSLAWTMLRPPMLGDGPPTGRWRFTADRPAHFRIERADLAAALVEALGRTDLARCAPFVATPRA
jgi:putative NADH-flavin reductase